MPVFRITQYIEAPPQAIWDFVSDLRRGPEYVDVMIKLVSVSEEPTREGTVYTELSQIGPTKSETEWTITTFDPPHLQIHETHSSDFDAILTATFEPQGEGTNLTYQVEYKLMPGLRPLGVVLEKLFVQRMMDKDLAQTVANIKRIMESGQA